MKVKKLFSHRPVIQLRQLAWAAILLSTTALLGLIIVWATGLTNLIDVVLTIIATIMFGILTASWWWLIWVVSRVLRKNKEVIIELESVTKNIRNLRSDVDEVLTKMINNLK